MATLFYILLTFIFSLVTATTTINVLHFSSNSTLLELAAQDSNRYLRSLICGSGSDVGCTTLINISTPGMLSPQLDSLPLSTATVMVVLGNLVPSDLLTTPFVSAGHPSLKTLGDATRSLTGDEHIVHSATLNGRSITLCTGATPRATLYAVYTFLELLGARFYLHGDVLPYPNASLSFDGLNSRLASPRFMTRGIQPFHDFPMGPDWWDASFWAATSTQMAKMKLNTWVRADVLECATRVAVNPAKPCFCSCRDFTRTL